MRAAAQSTIKYVSYQVRCPTPVHLAGSEAACLVPVRREKQTNKDELKMIYPQFCCVTCQKPTSVKKKKNSFSLCRDPSRPSGALRAISAPQRSALCRWLLGARFVIGHRTVALRHRQCASALGVEKGKRREGRGEGGEVCQKATAPRKKKTVLQVKQSELVRTHTHTQKAEPSGVEVGDVSKCCSQSQLRI